MTYDSPQLEVEAILAQKNLLPLFQPIVDIKHARIVAHEALIRGPVESKLHSPIALFNAASLFGLNLEMEYAAREAIFNEYGRTDQSHLLFVNFSPDCLLVSNSHLSFGLAQLARSGLQASNIVIEITESSTIRDYAALKEAVIRFKAQGFKIALDDLGEGTSGLRLWSELSPDYVKIDKHFIANIHHDPIKMEFVRGIQKIALESNTLTIAEGVETKEELAVIKDLKVDFAQGFLLGRPFPKFQHILTEEVNMLLSKNLVRLFADQHNASAKQATVIGMTSYQIAAFPEMTNEEVYHWFNRENTLNSIPVVNHKGKPLGLISRYDTIDRFARRYQKELHGKKSCTTFMDINCLIVQKDMTILALSEMILEADPKYLLNGFIIVDGERYVGMGSGHALLREVTTMQIHAARYANPLTLLPGNVPINAHIDKLLERRIPFVACYCDLDHFKPFNDAYGYRRGDEVIQFVGRLLSSMVNSDLDFVGHIGGDDFVLIFQTERWEAVCHDILDTVAKVMPDFYDLKDVQLGGIRIEDRLGNEHFYPFGSLSIGAVRAHPEAFASHHEVAGAMSNAKKQAKKTIGNSLFIERRKLSAMAQTLDMNAPVTIK
ncbi:GGDEF domain-containing protein [Methylophilus aquaticus]|uniref:GGDEF domain-containing protein n=1 Tax=Methylophilus aquaticus TaxID=1971610 RepID=A0ABT9JQ17_9PROT|nr:GGDEF domain-containing protein [Methylophilus aquaticus]MDP8566633.1 GGDEF domain-containing protein [Methylophilus aquaticus]